ncbi:MAG TPA: response regulator [Pseudorhizobium sp.]|jgi:CheY-like chemotaxis protein|nr:response regulator [Pseudorhizobium sp.]
MQDLSCLGTVLVVEDDFLIAMDLERMLAANGCNCVELAGSCQEAIERTSQAEYDLVTVDVKLSDGDCVELVRLLDDQGTPYIFVTGYDRGAYPAGPVPWVSKPVADDDLLAAIQTRLLGRENFRSSAEL